MTAKIHAHSQKLFVDSCEDLIFEFVTFFTNCVPVSKKNKYDRKLIENFIFDFTINLMSASFFHGLHSKEWVLLANARKERLNSDGKRSNKMTSVLDRVSIVPTDTSVRNLLNNYLEFYLRHYLDRDYSDLFKIVNTWDRKLDEIFYFDKGNEPGLILGVDCTSIIESHINPSFTLFERAATNEHIPLNGEFNKKLLESCTIDHEESTVTLSCETQRWADLNELVFLNLLIIFTSNHSLNFNLLLTPPYALSDFGREKIDWRCQLNFANYKIKTTDFSVHPQILTALGFSTDAYEPAPKRNISLKYSNETEIYPVVFVSQNFSITTRIKNLVTLWAKAIRYNLGVRIKTHPRNRLKAIERYFVYYLN